MTLFLENQHLSDTLQQGRATWPPLPHVGCRASSLGVGRGIDRQDTNTLSLLQTFHYNNPMSLHPLNQIPSSFESLTRGGAGRGWEAVLQNFAAILFVFGGIEGRHFHAVIDIFIMFRM